jgi:hypothetical protein
MAIVRELRRIDKPCKKAREAYSDEDIVLTWLWSVIHDRPVAWACQRANWPLHQWRRALPSQTCMSRRLRSQGVKRLLKELEKRELLPPRICQLMWFMDGKPLLISGCSKDRQSGRARGVGRGYKLHTILDPRSRKVAAWRVAPLNKDEKIMARRMVREAALQGYLVADGNYDSNPLHRVCEARGNLQLVTPHRASRVGRRRRYGQSIGRLRSLNLQTSPTPQFATTLLHQRDDIERYFGNLTSWGGGLTHLPPWIRTHRRVHRWVQAKLILMAIRRRLLQTTYDK